MLNEEQIQKVTTFFEANGVQYYDLRQELEDHLCLSIENRMKENPSETFEEAYNEEIKKFDKKDLALQNFNASLKYSPLKEWKYFNMRRVINFFIIYLLLVSPVLFFNARMLFYTEIFYFIVMVIIYIRTAIDFRREHTIPKKKLSIYTPYSFFELAFPILYISYRFITFFIQGKIPNDDAASVVFCGFVFILLLAVAATFARDSTRKQEYLIAKKLYPFLFNN